MKNMHDLTSKEWQLLSAYLDNQLSQKEKRKAENLLQENPVCLNALENMKRVRSLLRSLPEHRVPKNFTLSKPVSLRTPLPGWQMVLRYSSVATALLLSFALALDFVPAFQPLAVNLLPEEKTMAELPASADMEFAVAESQESPAIIFWGGAPMMGAFGKGGGDGTGAGIPPGYGIGGGGAEGYQIAPEAADLLAEKMLPEPLPETTIEAAPEETVMIPEEELPSAELEMLPEPPQEKVPEREVEISPDTLSLQESNPILGVRPADEQGRIDEITSIQVPTDIIKKEFSLRPFQIVLTILLVMLFLPAWLIKKK